MFCGKSTRLFRGINALYRQQQQRGKKSLKGRGKQKKQGKPNIFRVDSKQMIEAKPAEVIVKHGKTTNNLRDLRAVLKHELPLGSFEAMIQAKFIEETEEKTSKPRIGQAYHDGSNWCLPAGTLVKHGTTTNNLRKILKYGLLPRNIEGRSEFRKLTEHTPITKDGVYVGSCYIAYNASMHLFLSNIQALIKSKEIASCRFDSIKNKMMDTMQFVGYKGDDLEEDIDILLYKYVNKDKKLIEACGLPIVLNIKLKENVSIRADEDCLRVRFQSTSNNKRLMEFSAEPSWNEYGSAVILRSIPADWIETFECFEHNFQNEYFAFEKYCITNSLKNDSTTWNNSNKSREFVHFITEEKKKSSLARQNFETDLFHVCMATKLYKNETTDSRQQWKDILKRSNVFSKFRNTIDIEPYLDELEKDNFINMLGAGYSLLEEYVKKKGFWNGHDN